jgi:hypothetical protein
MKLSKEARLILYKLSKLVPYVWMCTTEYKTIMHREMPEIDAYAIDTLVFIQAEIDYYRDYLAED